MQPHDGEDAAATTLRATDTEGNPAPTRAPGGIERLFFALVPPSDLQGPLNEATARLVSAHGASGRRVAPARYHLTLRFVGSFCPLPSGLVGRAIAAAAQVRAEPFELPLDCAGSFPPQAGPAAGEGAGRRSGGRRSLWWLGCAHAPTGLLALRDALARALVAEGVRSEDARPFVPHVTILRHADRPLPVAALKPLRWPVADFVLMHSQVGGEHGAYAELGRWPLGGSTWSTDAPSSDPSAPGPRPSGPRPSNPPPSNPGPTDSPLADPASPMHRGPGSSRRDRQ